MKGHNEKVNSIDLPTFIQENVENLRLSGDLDEKKLQRLVKILSVQRKKWLWFWLPIILLTIIFGWWLSLFICGIVVYFIFHFDTEINKKLLFLYNFGERASGKITNKNLGRGGYYIHYIFEQEKIKGRQFISHIYQKNYTVDDECTILYKKENIEENCIFQKNINNDFYIKKDEGDNKEASST